LRATLLQQQQVKIEGKMMEDIAQKLSSCDIIIAQLCSSPRKEKVLIVQEILQRNNLLLLGTSSRIICFLYGIDCDKCDSVIIFFYISFYEN
jgi:hypothetical protein